MQPVITRAGAAVTIAIEAGAWLTAAALEFTAQYVRKVTHYAHPTLKTIIPTNSFDISASF
jgi:hypothetical protein